MFTLIHYFLHLPIENNLKTKSLFPFLCFSIFRMEKKPTIMRKTDTISVSFTGIKSKKNPLVFDFYFHDSLCKHGSLGRSKPTLGSNIIGEVKTQIPASTQFLENFESSCFCKVSGITKVSILVL